jgi:hypothetical protein
MTRPPSTPLTLLAAVLVAAGSARASLGPESARARPPVQASGAGAARSVVAEAEAAPPRVAARASGFHADLELDPTAYVLGGYSIHAGLAFRYVRLDLGAYAMTVPELVHKNEGFVASFDGYGVKVQVFPFAEQSGAFVGIDGGVTRSLVRLKGTELAARATMVGVGVDAGYRFDLVGGLYATPWVGVSRSFGAEPVALGGRTFEMSPWVVFPAVHLGLHLR